MMRQGSSRTSLAATLFVAISLALWSCGRSDEVPSAPVQNVPRSALETCGSQCDFIVDDRPFEVSHLLPDSSGASLLLATYTLHGRAGAQIALDFDLHGATLSPDAARVPVFVDIDGERLSIPLSELTNNHVVYDFASIEDVTVRYSLPRELGVMSAHGATLTQKTSAAIIVTANTPWARSNGLASRVSPSIRPLVQTCTVNESSFNACGVTGTIAPFGTASAPLVGCLWASSGTTGASGTIEITFAQPVQNITLTNCDSDFSGNEMHAYDANGTELGMVTFPGDGVTGNSNVQTQSIPRTGIRRVELRAAPNDFVAYRDLQFQPVGVDSIVLTPASASRKEGQVVTFTASALSGGVLTVTGWVWQSSAIPPHGDPITIVPSSCSGHTSCALPVYESGTLTVNGTVAGAATPQSVATVIVTACPSNSDPDVRIADPLFRKTMALLSDGTNFNERITDVYTNPNLHTFLPIEFPNNAAVPCLNASHAINATPLTPIPAGYVKDASDFHTHPWIASNLIPSSCDPQGRKAGLGPSYGEDPVSLLPTGDYPYEVSRQSAGYLMDPQGNVFRWNSQFELDPSHPSWYMRDNDANGKSSCLAPVTYQ